nr:replication protein A 70 kDa DNA-binding subunit D-like [Ipomoea batatas]
MAPMYIVVREIKKNKTTDAIKLRAVRTYDVPQSRFNQDIKSRECVLHDEEHVEKVMPYLRKDFAEPVIVLIQMGRVKVSENSAEVKITSSYDATQLLFNGDSSEFVDFRQSLSLQQTPLKSLTSNSAYSYGNSAYSYGNSSGGDLSSSKMRIITITDIYQNREVMIKIPKELKIMLGRGLFFKVNVQKNQLDNLSHAIPVMSVKHFPEMFNTYCLGLLADKDDGLSQVTDYETDSDEGFFSEEEAESPNVNAVKSQSVDVTESDAVKRSLLDQFSSTQNSKKKRVMVVKEEGYDDKET